MSKVLRILGIYKSEPKFAFVILTNLE